MSSCDNPNVDADALMTRRLKFDKSKLCVKCKENTGNIIIRHAVYCKSCFFPLISTRFRKTLEPQINPKPDGPRRKGLRASGSLLIGFSGGFGSTVLLDLVAKSYFHSSIASSVEGLKAKGGKDHPRNLTGKESGVWTGKPAVCYVEVSGAFDGKKDRTEEIKKVVDSYSSSHSGFEFDFIPLRIEDAFDENWWENIVGCDLTTVAKILGIKLGDESLPLFSSSPSTSSSPSPSTPLLSLHSYLSSLPTQTATHSAIQTLTRLLLLYTAAARDASHLLLGTSLTSLSINLISGIAQGAGFSVAEEAVEEWSLHPPNSNPQLDPCANAQTSNGKQSLGKRGSVRIVRPVRDIGMKECAYWVWWSGLRLVGRDRVMGGRQDIGSLTRDFIMGLEQDYPSTVSTIARTCAKVTPKDKSDMRCVLCGRPAQPGVQEWKTRISIRSYNDASFIRSGHPLPPHISSIPGPPEINVDADTPSTPTLTPYLCYACHTTLTSRSSRGTTASSTMPKIDIVPLPVWVRAELNGKAMSMNGESDGKQKVMGEWGMKNCIKAFILDDE